MTTSAGASQVTVNSTGVASVLMGDIEAFVATLESNSDIVVACINGANGDYLPLPPLAASPMYHWHSELARLVAVDCDTMAETEEVPVSTVQNYYGLWIPIVYLLT